MEPFKYKIRLHTVQPAEVLDNIRDGKLNVMVFNVPVVGVEQFLVEHWELHVLRRWFSDVCAVHIDNEQPWRKPVRTST